MFDRIQIYDMLSVNIFQENVENNFLFFISTRL